MSRASVATPVECGSPRLADEQSIAARVSSEAVGAGCEIAWRSAELRRPARAADLHMLANPGVTSLPPTGTVTFLFTDIEGSTTLWDRYPAAMQAALARHDKALRHAIESSDGHIVKTTGDGVFAVFDA